MPRSGRIAAGGIIYHVLNRGNGRARLFHQPQDYEAFLGILRQVKQIVPVKVLGYCLMPNHWHFALLPEKDGDLSRFMLRLTTTHVRRRFAFLQRTEGGHLYQGRFKNFPVQEDEHLLTLLRYIEANPLRAKLCRRAGDWKWSSFHAHLSGMASDLLDPLPLDLPPDWDRLVQDRGESDQVDALRECLNRGRPFGKPAWVNTTAAKLGLGFTLRPRGRPKAPASQID